MSQFVYVAAAATAILVVGGVMAGFMPEGGVNAVSESVTVFSTNLGTVGGADTVEASSRIINLGNMQVTETSPNQTVYEEDQLIIRNSVTGSASEVIQFEALKPQKAYLQFVSTTGAPAEDLIVTVNGEEIPVQSFSSGERVTIPIEKERLQKKDNVIQLSAEDPGLAFWQSPRFKLENVRLVLNDLQHSRVIKPFRAYDYEVEGFDHGEITFNVVDETVRSQPLHVAVNGREVTNRFTPVKRAEPYTINFFANTTGLSFGENTASFYTSGNAYYPLSNARLTLYYFSGTQQRTAVRNFNMNESVHKALGQDNWEGRITFDVERIFLERPVTIKLGDKTFTFTPTPGQNTRSFGQDAVSTGQNTLKLSTDGAYRITDFTVSIKKTGE